MDIFIATEWRKGAAKYWRYVGVYTTYDEAVEACKMKKSYSVTTYSDGDDEWLIKCGKWRFHIIKKTI